MRRDLVMRRLKAMTDGPTPPLHHVSQVGDTVAVTVQPWGHPIYLTWSQAEAFTKDLPVQLPPAKKSVASETGRNLKRKRA